MIKEMQALKVDLEAAEELKSIAHRLIASGAQELSPEVIAGLRALDTEIKGAKEVLHEGVH